MLASFVMMEVAAMQAENEICKFHGNNMKYDESDFTNAEKWANHKMRNY